MGRKISLLIAVILLLTCAFSGCAPAASEEASATADEGASQASTSFTEAPSEQSTQSTAEATLVSSTAAEEISSAPSADTTAPTVSKADTSDMDFEFEEEDITPETVPAATQAATEANNSSQQQKPAEHKNVTNITSGGTYVLKGKITDTTVTVDAGDEDVTIILENAQIANSKGPAIYVRSADKLIITLADGTSNSVSDGSSYNKTDGSTTVDGAIFSKADLTVNGYGSLTVKGNNKHGIVSKDDLVISSGVINVTSKNIGLTGKDCVKINSGNITVKAGSDGIRADNATDPSKGFVYFYGGAVNITSGNDGVQAETVINIEDADLSVTAGGGGNSKKPKDTEDSFKALKAGSDIYITGGDFNLSSLDDCIHSNGTVTIGGGSYTLLSGDDGVHADSDMLISGGSLDVKTLSKGIDVNGNLTVNGGNISVCTDDKAIISFDGGASVSGGSFVGTGSADKSMNFSICNQTSLAVNTGELAEGTKISLTDSKGNVIKAFTAEQDFSAVIISDESIVKGSTYKLTAGSFTKEVTA